jgi:O-antigen/teichoic acid export membrane protein
MLGFSSLGLGHWFIREIINNENKTTLTNKFFKVQLLIGILFYIINLIASYLLYDNQMIRTLSVIIGINIIFDNIINVIKSLNIAYQEQQKTFLLLTIEALLKFLVGCLLLLYKLDMILLSVILIGLRLITLNLFIKMGSSNSIGLKEIIKVKIDWAEIKKIVLSNWSFIIISSLSIVNWRIGNILVSKILTIQDVANYEIAFKFFSLAYLIPIIVTSSMYPMLINAFKEGPEKLKSLYSKAYLPLCIYGFLSFTFVYAFADFLVPFIFGKSYSDTALYCKQMFYVMLIFPTIFLQANVILTLKLEKFDMICNIVSVLVNVAICIIGFQFYKSLTVVNVAIFTSFLVFHIIQDVILIRNKITNLKNVMLFYFFTTISIGLYIFSDTYLNSGMNFLLFWVIILIIVMSQFKKIKIAYSTH